MSTIARRAFFSGRVQGVGFRFTAYRIARRYGLTGFVKNLSNGSVEMLAQGTAENVAACLHDIAESFGSYIRDTKITNAEPTGKYDEFKIAF